MTDLLKSLVGMTYKTCPLLLGVAQGGPEDKPETFPKLVRFSNNRHLRFANFGPVPSESTSTTGSNSVAEGNRKSEHVAGHDFGAGPKSGVPSASALSDAQSSADGQEVSSEPREPRYDKKRSVKGSIHLAGATSNAFARASNLIREALSAEGVVFVDAHVASSSARGTQDRSDSGSFDDSDGRGTTASSIGDDRPNSMSENDYSDQGERENATCKLNGFSTRKRSTLTGSKSDHVFDLPETRLAALIRRYPAGHIFNYADSGDMYSSSGDEHTSTSAGSSGSAGHRAMRASGRRLRRQCRDAEMLGSVMPGARTIAFYPVWDVSLALFVIGDVLLTMTRMGQSAFELVCSYGVRLRSVCSIQLKI